MTTNKNGLPELLAPAGSYKALEAAVNAGADAVYLGMSGFNARANAANFSDGELKSAIADAHAAGVRVHVTLNTLIYDREMREFLSCAEKAGNAGADALIVADPGGAAAILRTMPGLKLHASTQMSVHSTAGGVLLRDAGFSRVVLAREMPENEIASFCKNAGVEAEIFIHGALCVCHSGQCLFSSLVGGRSGNRGECAQPCRLPYKTPGGAGYPLSLKDLCLAQRVPEILSLGVSSLKIEGRMKPADYVGAVVSVWRRLLDERRPATPDEMNYLSDVFSRSGFTSGYFDGKIGRDMLGVRSDADKRRTASAGIHVNSAAKKDPLSPSGLTFDSSGYEKKEPVSAKKRQKTAFFYDPKQLTEKAVDYFDTVFLPVERIGEALRIGKRFNGAALPPVIFDGEEREISRLLDLCGKNGIRHLLVGNAGHLRLAKGRAFTVHGDLRLNVCNGESMAEREREGFADCILSTELTLPRIRDIGGASLVTVYGRIPLMVTEKCAGLECGNCDRCEKGKNVLTDRMGKTFPVLRTFRHRSVIYNSVPVYMGDRKADLRRADIRGMHFIFTVETQRQIDGIIEAFEKGTPLTGGAGFRRIR